jgi:hypothetical protein
VEQLFDIRERFIQAIQRGELDNETFKRLSLELLFHVVYNLRTGGEPSWTFSVVPVLTTQPATLLVKVRTRQDKVRVKINNFDHDELRTLYVGQDSQVRKDQAFPIQPGETLDTVIERDLYGISPFVGTQPPPPTFNEYPLYVRVYEAIAIKRFRIDV